MENRWDMNKIVKLQMKIFDEITNEHDLNNKEKIYTLCKVIEILTMEVKRDGKIKD